MTTQRTQGEHPADSHEKRRYLTLVLLFLFGFTLRAVGADYGYFHGDEPIAAAARVLTGELVPGQHFYPPLVNYLHALGFAGLFVVGLISNWWDGTEGFRSQFFEDPTVFYVTARLVTAAIGALVAPLFYMIARRVGLAPRFALLVGVAGALFPLGVFMSHIAKGDVALATAIVAMFWAIIARFDTERPVKWDVLIAVFVVLAMSFKQSSLFILLPSAIGVSFLVWRAEGALALLWSLLRIVLTGVILWPILNIGILLDFQNFLEFQRIQTVMSLRTDDGMSVGVWTLFERIWMPVLGLNPVFAIVAVAFPIIVATRRCELRHKPVLIVIWVSLLAATLALAVISGARQPEHLWIANFAGFTFLSVIALASLIQATDRRFQIGGSVVLALGLVGMLIGAAIPIRQAVATPLRTLTDAFIAEELADEMIMTMVDIGLPQRREAQALQLARWDRLAERYSVTMPELAEERLIQENVPGSVFYLAMPTVMYGLEGVDEDDVDFVVQPHAWPPQREEWQLDYWTEQGFEIFLVSNLQFNLDEIDSQLMRAFFHDMVERCEVEMNFVASKQLFLERDVTIFRCSG